MVLAWLSWGFLALQRPLVKSYGWKVNCATGLGLRGGFGQKSRVRLWCGWCGRCSRCGGTDGSILVACAIAAVWRQRVGVQGFVLPWCQVSFAWRHCWRHLAGLGAKDESGLVLLLQVGHVLHHGFTVGDRQLVGTIWHQVKAAGNEDNGKREHGDYDESKAHGKSPGRVALETFLSLQIGRHIDRKNVSPCLFGQVKPLQGANIETLKYY